MLRHVLTAGVAFLVCGFFSQAAEAQSIGDSMVSFLQSRVGTRVGGGECAHLATEALRASGAEFVASDLGPDSPSTGDYVWGTLVTTISFANKTRTDSSPSAAVLPGDVIQYGAATFTYSKTNVVKTTKHTSVVAAVNSSNRPSSVYQQNYGGNRTVQTAVMDVTKLTAGWIRIYRPIARKDTANKWKFSVVNNTTVSQTYTIMVGTSTVSTITLTAANTASSFKVQTITTTGTVPCLVLSNGQSIYLTNAKGDEIYTPTAGVSGVRELNL